LRRARPACVSAQFGLLKACESSLKKPSACTMCGAPRLNFAGGAAGCTCGSGIFAVLQIRDLTARASEALFPRRPEQGEWGRGPVLRLTARVWRGVVQRAS
jgi:hypothetical protein